MFRRYEYLEGLTSLNDSNGKYLIYKGHRFRLGVSSDVWPETLLSTC